jgi:hypothetical protein
MLELVLKGAPGLHDELEEAYCRSRHYVQELCCDSAGDKFVEIFSMVFRFDVDFINSNRKGMWAITVIDAIRPLSSQQWLQG